MNGNRRTSWQTLKQIRRTSDCDRDCCLRFASPQSFDWPQPLLDSTLLRCPRVFVQAKWTSFVQGPQGDDNSSADGPTHQASSPRVASILCRVSDSTWARQSRVLVEPSCGKRLHLGIASQAQSGVSSSHYFTAYRSRQTNSKPVTIRHLFAIW